jgi:hypothetical protein
MKNSHISNNMMNSGKMVIGDENRSRESHGHYRHPTPTTHTPRVSFQKMQSGNSIFSNNINNISFNYDYF